MPPFRRVEARQAGANALGILVPLGERTLVIVRPRALAWDLLAARWNGDRNCSPTFCEFAREEAAKVARRLQRTLEESVLRGDNPIESFGGAGSFQIWLRTEEYVWILCRRAPGQAYQPVAFETEHEAASAAQHLVPYLWPVPDANQEFYFNTQNFGDARAAFTPH